MGWEKIRYLEAKRSVDERSLSVRVRDRLLSALPPAPVVFEAGCGTGVTVPRFQSWGVDDARYVGVDSDPEVVAFAREVRPAQLRRTGSTGESGTGDQSGRLDFEFETGDALSAVSASDPDLVVAQQFMDLVDVPRALDRFETALGPGGLAYFPLTFDDLSVFQPSHPADDAVLAAYHATMDDRENGDSRAGRHLADTLRRRPGDLLAMDASDAIVRPRNGRYPHDERFFLGSILDFVASEVPSSAVPGRDEWLAARREQLAAGELLYVAHRYDLLYRTPAE